MSRDPLSLTFVFVFPIVTMLIIGGVVRHRSGPGVRRHEPVALVRRVVPHRRDRRDRPGHAAGAPGRLPRARRAAPVRGGRLPALVVRDRPTRHRAGHDRGRLARPARRGRAGLRHPAGATHAWRVAAGLVVGSLGFVSVGVLLGSLLPSARAAQAVGLLLFFPSFLLGAGGPPPHVMGSASAPRRRRSAIDAGHQIGSRAVARSRYRDTGADRGSRARRRGDVCRGAAHGPVKVTGSTCDVT